MHCYAIGDIHGHLSLLHGIHDRIAQDQAVHGPGTIIHVGDLVDRGPDSNGVIEYLRSGMAAGENWVVLKGNHDRMFAGFLADIRHHDEGLRSDLSWLHPRLGGAETLASYGVRHAGDRPIPAVHDEAVALVPTVHLDFINSLPTHHAAGEAVFVHAGIRPGIALARQTETDLVWIRKGFLEDTRDHGALIVHGHTAIDLPTHYSNRVNIDSSAAYGGPLSAIVVEGREVWTLTAKGRFPLKP